MDHAVDPVRAGLLDVPLRRPRRGVELVGERGEAGGERAEVSLRVVGAHQALNAAAAAAAALALGLPLADAAASLSGLETLSRWRMELHELPGGVVLLNDAYNANPDSMRAGLRALAALGTEDPLAITRTGEPAFRGQGLAGADRDTLLDALAAEPKLITCVTMSPGWNPKLASFDCFRASSSLIPACCKRCSSHGTTRSGRI